MEDSSRMAESPVSPLLLDARAAAKICGVSRSHFLAMHSAGRIPLPVRLGRRVLWRAAELTVWIEAGCPSRDRWQSIRGDRE